MRAFLSLFGVVVVAGLLSIPGSVVSDDDSSQPAVPKYESKLAIESPSEKLVATALPAELSKSTPPTPDRHPIAAVPGKVDWLADFDAACRASRDSGKPVLLFQLMGRLDEVFC